MSSFTKPLDIRLIGKNKFQLLNTFEYYTKIFSSDENFIVPIGFETDFASIPRLFWVLISPIDRHGKAAVVHDYLYKTKLISRKDADDIFKEALIVLEVNKWKIFCMYWSVRLFGWYIYYGYNIQMKNFITKIKRGIKWVLQKC